MAKNMVTITLEEYKELLLREKPTDQDKETLTRVFDIIEQNLSYGTYSYDEVMKDVVIKDSRDVIKQIFTMLKYVDFDRYMEIWNKVMTNERKRKEQELLIKQMNEAKELRKESEAKE